MAQGLLQTPQQADLSIDAEEIPGLRSASFHGAHSLCTASHLICRVRSSAVRSVYLSAAILDKKPEHIVCPNRSSKVAKGVTVFRGIAVRGIDLQLIPLACILHHGRKYLTRLQVIVVRGLEEEDWYLGVLNGMNHNGLQ
jgi:hypothetical protein